MKKLNVMIVLCFFVNLTAQNISVAPDFTGTDIHGNVHNLYEYLDKGMHVWVHTTGKY